MFTRPLHPGYCYRTKNRRGRVTQMGKKEKMYRERSMRFPSELENRTRRITVSRYRVYRNLSCSVDFSRIIPR